MPLEGSESDGFLDEFQCGLCVFTGFVAAECCHFGQIGVVVVYAVDSFSDRECVFADVLCQLAFQFSVSDAAVIVFFTEVGDGIWF